MADASGGVRVTLEIVDLDELFTALEINETLGLLHARPEFDDEVLAAYEIARHPDGSIEFVPRAAAASLVLPAQVTGVRALGVFDCSTTTTFPFSLPKAPQFTITPTVKMQLDYSLAAGLRKLGAEGAVKAEFKFEPKVSASFDGKLECEVELMAFPIPVGGPIALVIGGQVPIGVGFELKGKLVVAELGLDVNAAGTATFGMGVTCPEGDCEPYATGNLTVDPKVTLRLPNVDEQLRARHGGHVRPSALEGREHRRARHLARWARVVGATRRPLPTRRSPLAGGRRVPSRARPPWRWPRPARRPCSRGSRR